ncbi:MAG: hypothetical protein LWW81_00295 [Rhodocyclales bacterium]|nr:hypothetical protein [Rhodocyclales bacterium]
MRYTYKFNVLEADGRLVREREQIDAANWLDYLQANTARYGNLHEFIASALAAMKGENPLVAASIANQLDDSFAESEPTVVCQFALYCWQLFKAGEIPAGAWAGALAIAWQSCERSLLDTVALSEALVVRMFEAADKEALYRAGASREGWDAYFNALPDHVDVYRGVTTGLKHGENGLSWTLSPEIAKHYSGRNVQKANEIPGVICARVPKAAILAVFDQAQEVVLNPSVAKEIVQTSYLSGNGLSKFRQNWKKWRAEEAEKIRKARLR